MMARKKMYWLLRPNWSFFYFMSSLVVLFRMTSITWNMKKIGNVMPRAQQVQPRPVSIQLFELNLNTS